MVDKLLGNAEWSGKTVSIRLARKADPTRRRIDLRDVVGDVLGESMAILPELALAQGQRVAHMMSVAALELRAAPPVASVATGTTVVDWSELWHADRLRCAIVVDDRAERSLLKCHVHPLIGHRLMRAVTRVEIEAIVTRLDALVLAGEISWKTAANAWGMVRTMFRDACRSKPTRGLRVRDDDPTTDVEPPTRGMRRTKAFLYPSEFLTLVTSREIWDADGRQFQRARHARRWMRLFTLAVYLQMRAGELRVLRWTDLDCEHWVLHVKRAAVRGTAGKKEKDTKGGTTRPFEIEPELRPLLSAMRKEAGGDTAIGRMIKVPPESDLSDRLRTYCRAAGLTRADLYTNDAAQAQITFHDLRATGITWRAVRGDNPFAMQDAVGHTDLKTTQIYIRKAAALGAGFGVPFPPVPERVIGDLPPAGARLRKARRPKSVPSLSQESRKAMISFNNRATPMGIENGSVPQNPRKTQGFGSIGPTDVTDRDRSGSTVGSESDPVMTALRTALDAAIAAGNGRDAARLAAKLAAESSGPSAVVLPLRRR